MVEQGAPSTPNEPCHSERCPLLGHAEYMGYCYSCAKRLEIVPDNSGAAAAAAPPALAPTSAPSATVAAVPVAAPTSACGTEGCSGAGQADTLGYCVECATRLGIPVPPSASGAASSSTGLVPAPASGAAGVPMGSVGPAASSAAQAGDCRGGCGFFSSPQLCGLCSSCWKKLGGDLYLEAVVGIAVDRTDKIQTFLDAGGTILRKSTDADVDALRAVGFYVSVGKTLTELANELGMMNALSFLLQRDTSLTVVSDLDRRSTVSMLLADDDDDKPSDTTAPRHVDDEGAVVFATENVRLEVISTQDVRAQDNLVHFWTACDPDDAASEYTVVANGGRMESAATGKGFALPASLRKLPGGATQRTDVLRRFVEQQDMLDDVTRAIGFFPAVPQCDEVVPLYTVADLNCLMHGAFTAMAAVRDGILASDDPDASTATTRTVLRNAVRNSIKHCHRLQRAIAAAPDGFNAPPQKQVADEPAAAAADDDATPGAAAATDDVSNAPPGAASAAANDLAQGTMEVGAAEPAAGPEEEPASPVVVVPGVDAARLKQLQHDIDLGKASLDGGHVFALANVLRRPIIVYAHVGLEGEFRKELTVPFRISGIYLPLLWAPEKTCPDPLLLCYSAGHFSAVVPIAPDADTDEQPPLAKPPRSSFDFAVPLCDEEFVPLPVHFLTEVAAAGDVAHIARVLDGIVGMDQSKSMSGGSPLTRRPMGPRHRSAETAVLNAYLRRVEAVPLIEGMVEEDEPADADDADEENAVPRITLCRQRISIPGPSADLGDDASETERYLARLKEAVDAIVLRELQPAAGATTTTSGNEQPTAQPDEPPCSANRAEGADGSAATVAGNHSATVREPAAAAGGVNSTTDAPAIVAGPAPPAAQADEEIDAIL